MAVVRRTSDHDPSSRADLRGATAPRQLRLRGRHDLAECGGGGVGAQEVAGDGRTPLGQAARRSDNQHLGFSQGIHFCFGAPLARLEVQLAVGEFVRRVQNPRLVEDPPPYRHHQILRGPRHLLVDIDGSRR